MRVLILGNGLLGQELASQSGWDVISRKVDGLEFTDEQTYINKVGDYDVIVNCIACTKTYSTDFSEHWTTNVTALNKLIDVCNRLEKKLVHISTDYVYAQSKNKASELDDPVPLNTWYGYTKLVGDVLVQAVSKNYLICRLSHKPNPFPYESAWVDMRTSGDYVDVISDYIIKLIKHNASGIYNVGTEDKSMYELAIRTNNNVKKTNKPSHVPENTTMDLTKLYKFLKTIDNNL